MTRIEELWEGWITDKLRPGEMKELYNLIGADREGAGFLYDLLQSDSYKQLSTADREQALFSGLMNKARSQTEALNPETPGVSPHSTATSSQTTEIHLPIPDTSLQPLFAPPQTAVVRPLPSSPRLRTLSPKVAIAAAILMALIAGTYLLFRHKEPVLSPTTAQALIPGGNKATLTLANGSKILLNSAASGILARQGGATVIKTGNDQLSYAAPAGQGVTTLYNTITTPRGGQYQLILPDGSHVWLNSASSLTYPTSFSGSRREVTLDGEAYFEITALAAKPFSVHTASASVQVLGTAFNIMAYSDEPVCKTTLVNGAVKVEHPGGVVTLQPGQQAQALATGPSAPIKVIKDADLEEVLAWKNGRFLFTEAGITMIMRQVARWYDVDIEYKGDLSGIVLSGKMSRKEYAGQLLEILEATKRVHFIVKGKTITVTPYH